ncbi:DUF3114 domain-containing protein [Xylocopilactobacillus apis]|uniref:DUF3114 domain-containing protein n=1 Tax=Xylocopilactobacillus apis TaxID=2932183 RepID=A0AAU9DQH8_9LACO|nr:DUF3114 domain-containing protein [Xylocopilactobacillus apis]BDR57368.1 hypothetical protein KIMC2_19300 [Xylocopilactobacillus apis]
MKSEQLIKLEIESLRRDGWNRRALKTLINVINSDNLKDQLIQAHLIGSEIFSLLIEAQFKKSSNYRQVLSFIMGLVTNTNGEIDFSLQAPYHFDPKMGPDNPFLSDFAKWVRQAYFESQRDQGPEYVGLNDQLGCQLQIFRQLIDQQNVRFLINYSQNERTNMYQGLLRYLKNKNIKPKFSVEANFHSKYLKEQGFSRQKNFKIEVENQMSEFIFSLDLGHSIVSQWVRGTRLLPDGTMDLTYNYTDLEQENILDGESFNYGYGGTKFQHRYLDVNQPVVNDVRTKLKAEHRWTSENDWYAVNAGDYADIVRQDSETDILAWDDYQLYVKQDESQLLQKYRDFVDFCRMQNVNKGFADYYKKYGRDRLYNKKLA